MRSSRLCLMFGFTVALLGAVGCADPAKGKPGAVVGEAAPTPVGVNGKRYLISEDGSTLGFVGSKITGSHDGGFNSFSGEITLLNGNPVGSRVKLTIDTKSIWADNDRLKGHLESADFFDVEGHPLATFESTSIEASDGNYMLTGNLNLHGVTKSVSFPAAIEIGDAGIKAQAEFAIKRFDFNIAYKGKADDLIRDDVVIKFDLVALPEAG